MSDIPLSICFGRWLAGIVRFKDTIDEIDLDTVLDNGYQEEHDKVYLRVVFNSSVEHRERIELETIDSFFYPFLTVNEYGFTSYCKAERSDDRRDSYLKELKEFYDLYTNAAVMISQTVSAVIPDCVLRIGSLEKYPEFNYINKYWSVTDFSRSSYYRLYNRDFYDDCRLCFLLFEAANGFDKTITKNTVLVSDFAIAKYIPRAVNLHKLILKYKIPFKINGGRIVEELLFDALKFTEILKTEGEDLDADIKETILFLIGREIYNKGKWARQRDKLLENYPLKVGDYLLLKNNNEENQKIALIKSITFNRLKTLITCTNVNKDLDTPGKRVYYCYDTDVDKLLSSEEYFQQKLKADWQHRNHLMRYFKKIKSIDLKPWAPKEHF